MRGLLNRLGVSAGTDRVTDPELTRRLRKWLRPVTRTAAEALGVAPAASSSAPSFPVPSFYYTFNGTRSPAVGGTGDVSGGSFGTGVGDVGQAWTPGGTGTSANAVTLNTDTGWTLSLWVRTPGAGWPGFPMGLGFRLGAGYNDGTTSFTPIEFGANNQGTKRLYGFITNSAKDLTTANIPQLSGNVTATDATWYHLVYQSIPYSIANRGKLYLNGVLWSTGTSPASALLEPWTNTNLTGAGWRLTHSNGLAATRYAHVGFWNTPLSDAEVAQLYGGGTPFDPTA